MNGRRFAYHFSLTALYEDLIAYFGELPPARDGSEWQITGYLMRDPERFTAAGLVPSSLPPFHHGLNRRRRFWMHEQSLDYYNEHLLLHEAIHCFMTTLPVPSGPAWYMEGMAEHFATHRTFPGGNVEFGIIPATPDETPGFRSRHADPERGRCGTNAFTRRRFRNQRRVIRRAAAVCLGVGRLSFSQLATGLPRSLSRAR